MFLVLFWEEKGLRGAAHYPCSTDESYTVPRSTSREAFTRAGTSDAALLLVYSGICLHARLTSVGFRFMHHQHDKQQWLAIGISERKRRNRRRNTGTMLI